jgi:hypothetical protein
VLFLIVCLFCIGLVIYESIQQTRLAFYGVKTNASFVHVERRSHTIQFTTEAGAVIEVKNVAKSFLASKRNKVGDVVPIVYLPAHPQIAATQGIQGCTFLFIAIGVLFIGIIGLAETLLEYRWKNS